MAPEKTTAGAGQPIAYLPPIVWPFWFVIWKLPVDLSPVSEQVPGGSPKLLEQSIPFFGVSD